MGSFFGLHDLQIHPSTPAKAVTRVSAHIMQHSTKEFVIEFNVIGDGILFIPAKASPIRTDNLWHTTCFEIFMATESGRYVEFNLSPSFAWAAYAFDGYRQGMRNLDLPFEPDIEITPSPTHFFLYSELPPIDNSFRTLALSAVIEETDGTKSYWALHHPPGKPDFHHPDCFRLHLPAPAVA
ncbi:MAG: DOMON-like domain-containing protein [Sphingorhabdus sp.]